uniref:Uncharacterized protein n=1 Tax=Anguilla anguilla TaxID=7936 RepID=A0A0E9QPC5_ANGAN
MRKAPFVCFFNTQLSTYKANRQLDGPIWCTLIINAYDHVAVSFPLHMGIFRCYFLFLDLINGN